MKDRLVMYTMLFDFYGAMLTEKQNGFFDLYYNHDLSLGEIADNEGITRQGVRDAIARAEDTLSEFEEKLGLAAKHALHQSYIEQMANAASYITAVNEQSFQDAEIRRYANIISELTEKMRD